MPLALITGGGSLIGEGIACALVARGWQVAVTDINLDLARKVALAAGGMPHAEALALDATDRAQVDATVKTLLDRHGGIDALVNAAGGMRGLGIQKADFADTTPDVWDRILTANLRSVLNCTHAVLPAMIAAQARRDRQHRGEPRPARRTRRLDLLGRQGRDHRVLAIARAGGRPARHPRQHDRAGQRGGALEDAGAVRRTQPARARDLRRGRRQGGRVPACPTMPPTSPAAASISQAARRCIERAHM